jgi:hypothetical protein
MTGQVDWERLVEGRLRPDAPAGCGPFFLDGRAELRARRLMRGAWFSLLRACRERERGDSVHAGGGNPSAADAANGAAAPAGAGLLPFGTFRECLDAVAPRPRDSSPARASRVLSAASRISRLARRPRCRPCRRRAPTARRAGTPADSRRRAARKRRGRGRGRGGRAGARRRRRGVSRARRGRELRAARWRPAARRARRAPHRLPGSSHARSAPLGVLAVRGAARRAHAACGPRTKPAGFVSPRDVAVVEVHDVPVRARPGG